MRHLRTNFFAVLGGLAVLTLSSVYFWRAFSASDAAVPKLPTRAIDRVLIALDLPPSSAWPNRVWQPTGDFQQGIGILQLTGHSDLRVEFVISRQNAKIAAVNVYFDVGLHGAKAVMSTSEIETKASSIARKLMAKLDGCALQRRETRLSPWEETVHVRCVEHGGSLLLRIGRSSGRVYELHGSDVLSKAD